MIVIDVPTTRPSRTAITEQSRANVSFSKYTSRTASNGGGGGSGSGRGMSIWVVESDSYVDRWNATLSVASASSVSYRSMRTPARPANTVGSSNRDASNPGTSRYESNRRWNSRYP